MKKLFSLMLTGVLALSMLAGCAEKAPSGGEEGSAPGAQASQGTQGESGEESYRVAVVMNNNLGDKTISDLAWAGAQRASDELGMEVKVIELLGDATKQVPTLTELAESGEWDIIVAGLFNLREAVEQVAREYPEQKFISYDTELLFAGGGLENCYSVMARQNEAAFLGGAVAAKFTQSGFGNTNADKIIGFVGGGENSAVNDFLVGYIDGAVYADPDTKVLVSYVGNFTDSAKAKELALTSYQQGADIVFSVASGAGMGVLDAAKESGKYAIGVDQDQATLRKESGDMDTANQIVTSVVKKMDNIVFDALKAAKDGTLEWGKHAYVGLADDSMGLADNEIYQTSVSEEVRNYAEEIKSKIVSGEIVVKSAIGMSTEEVKAIRDQVKP